MTTETPARTWRTRTNTKGFSFVEWRPGYVVPPSFTSTIDGSDLPYLVELELSATEGGELDCSSVRVYARDGGEPVTARGLRETIRLGELIQTAVAAAARPVRQEEGGITIELATGVRDISDVVELASPVRRQRRRLSDEHLREVARVYNEADEHPVQAVQKHKPWAPVSYSTAARWVAQARERPNPATGKPFLTPSGPR